MRKLYACGIFEDIDKGYIEKEVEDLSTRDRITRKVLDEDFIICGNANLKEINVKTGTLYNEQGQTYKQICSMRESREEKQLDKLVHVIQAVYSRFSFCFCNVKIY